MAPSGFDRLSEDYFAHDSTLFDRRLDAFVAHDSKPSAPDGAHARIVTGLAGDLSMFAMRRHMDCRVLGTPELGRFYHGKIATCMPPDISVFCGAHKLGDDYDGYPDFAVEVVPSFDVSWDQVIKYPLYQEHGTREYWVVDTRAQRTLVRLFDACNEQIVNYPFTCPVPVGVFDGRLAIVIGDYLR
jgi:hypothetical protein